MLKLSDMKSFSISKLCLAVLMTIYFLSIIFDPATYHFMDYINLIFHEAGHTLMMFFGKFIHVAGGTIFQIIIPAFIVFYFYKRTDYFSASIVLFWLGQSFINISVYSGDAIVQILPLLGGDGENHDWTYLLSSLGILKYTPQVSGFFFFIGIVIILLASYFSIINSKKEIF